MDHFSHIVATFNVQRECRIAIQESLVTGYQKIVYGYQNQAHQGLTSWHPGVSARNRLTWSEDPGHRGRTNSHIPFGTGKFDMAMECCNSQKPNLHL